MKPGKREHLVALFHPGKKMKKIKKTVDNLGSVWYYKQALDAGDKSLSWARFSKSKASLNERTKNHLTVRKKFLTSELRYGKLIESPVRATKEGEACRADRKSWKKLEKTLKKLLTRSKRCGKITPAAAKRCVPCKLNNVTNTKHQIGFGCSNKLSLKDNR